MAAGGKGVIFTVHRKEGGTDTLALLAGRTRKVLLRLENQEIWHPVYSPTGHILFRRQPDNEGIWALPFPLSKLEPTGDPFLAVPGGNIPTVSDDGTLVCILGGSSGMQQLAWVDRKGDVQSLVGQPQPDIVFVSLSPDGHRVAVQSHEGDNWDIWVHDVARGTKTRLTFEAGMEGVPSWSPAGDRVAYVQQDRLMIKAADGAGSPESIGEGNSPVLSPDGKYVLYEGRSDETKSDLWIRPIGKEGAPTPLVHTKAFEWGGRISPDGRYVVYVSDESGKPEIYLARFPTGEGKWQVSVSGGNWPIWSRRGDEIFYRAEDALMAVPVESGAAPVLGTPARLFESIEKGLSLRPRSYDVAPDGQRFITVKRLEKETARNQLIVIANWFAEFSQAP